MRVIWTALAHFLLERAWKNKRIGHYLRLLASEVCACIEKVDLIAVDFIKS